MSNKSLSFSEWKRLVDEAVWDKAFVGIDDLPDVPLRDWYDDGISPKNAASRAIRSAREE